MNETDILIIGGGIAGVSTAYHLSQYARDVTLSERGEVACGASGLNAEIRFAGGKVFGRDNPGQGISMAELIAAAHDREMLPGGKETGLEFNGSYTLPDSPYSFAAHVVVVEVKRDTGQVSILRYVGVHDSGRIINPMLVEGQIHGGIAQGIGQALTEGMVYTPDGQPITASLLDYALPRASTIPDLVLENIETPSPTNPLGAKGVGSVSTVPAPVAVTNAVLDALSDWGCATRHAINAREAMAGHSREGRGSSFSAYNHVAKIKRRGQSEGTFSGGRTKKRDSGP